MKRRALLGFGLWPWALGVAVCASVASAQNVDWPSERPPRPLAARKATFPPYEMRTLANGLQVMAKVSPDRTALEDVVRIVLSALD